MQVKLKVRLLLLALGAIVSPINASIKNDTVPISSNSRISQLAKPTNSPSSSITTTTPTGINQLEPLDTLPSITSIHHQVWTSSSSGSSDELSPEIISKLRHDVPFLAAYALRPRLIGGVSTSVPVGESEMNLLETNPSDNHETAVGVDNDKSKYLDTGAASSIQPRAAGVGQLVGDFSELNVETASTSKSEHHHRRKTSLKKRPKSDAARTAHLATGGGGRRRQVSLDETSKLIRQQRRNRRWKLNSKSTKKQDRRKRRQKSKQSVQTKRDRRRRRTRRLAGGKMSSQKSHLVRVGRLRRKLNQRNLKHHLDIIRHGRLLQAPTESLPGGVKGGSQSNAKQAPTESLPASGGGIAASSGTTDLDKSKVDNQEMVPDDDKKSQNDLGAGEDELDEDDGGALEDELHGEPRRVGDPDVDEEEGDTVMVEPKFDGVEDDPPLPAEMANNDDDDADDNNKNNKVDDENDLDDGGNKSPVGEDGREREATTRESSGGPSPRVSPESDQRGNRVNRQKPNPVVTDGKPSLSRPPDQGGQDDDDDEEHDGATQPAGVDQSLGGGFGASVGGTGSSSPSPGGGGGGSKTPDVIGSREQESGVEFADERKKERVSPGGDGSTTTGGGSSVGKSKDDHDDDDDDNDDNDDNGDTADRPGDFGNRQPRPKSTSSSSGGKASAGDSTGGNNDDVDDDLDYRQDDDEDGDTNSSKGHKANSNGSSGGSSSSNGSSFSDSSSSSAKADDGSYKHHDESYHDAHHQTSDWLRGSIPGEPGDDYPTLSRTNGSNFDCQDQKLPGYYADVESRCQVFHICQMDGRQDSFLCPNGTIFSQKSFVCVWWSGFDCEDPIKSSTCLIVIVLAAAVTVTVATTTTTGSKLTSSLSNQQHETNVNTKRMLDAPRYYHLNALLYKTVPSRDCDHIDNGNGNAIGTIGTNSNSDSASKTSNEVHRELRPLDDGASRVLSKRPVGEAATAAAAAADEDEEDEAPIDGLIRAMKARGSNADEATTIQRKSSSASGLASAIDSDDDDENATLSKTARLRKSKAIIPRRKRASARQSPPKLKSRRVSRNSRRRRVRIKPKRRA